MLVDTGSVVTLMNASKAQELKLKLNCTNLPMLRGAGENVLNTPGYVSGHLKLGNTSIYSDVLVTEDLGYDFVLGADALDQLGAIIDLPMSRLQLKKGVVPLLVKRKSHPIRVALVQSVMVPARHEMIVPGRIKSSSPIEEVGYLENSDMFYGKHGLVSAHVVVKPDEQCKVPVRIMNPSMKPVELFKGTTVAGFTPVTNSDDVIDWDDDPLCVSPVSVDPAKQSETVQAAVDKLTDLDAEQTASVHALFEKHKSVFSTGSKDLGRTNKIYHIVDTGDSVPIKQKVRKLPFHKQEHVSELLTDMKDGDIIQPSTSPWASSIVLLMKKDGTTRFCLDYRKVNEKSRKDAYPLPRIEEALELLNNACWFSTMDLASGYWQIEMHPDSIDKTAFVTHQGLFEFKVLPFGLTGATATFQMLMDCVLSGLLWKSCLVYLDDVIVFSKSFDEHVNHLNEVFEVLHKSNLKIKPSKCKFFKCEVVYLGHTLSKDGVNTESAKTERISNWPTPKSLTEVRSFLGLANYYRNFVKNFSDLAYPLTRLTEKNIPFVWSDDCQRSFDSLKSTLVSTPVLAYPDFSKEFILDTDASATGMGAVLSQVKDGQEVVIAYASKKFSKAQKNYSATRREMLALVTFVQHFRHYLLGKTFRVRVDHSSLKWLFSFKEPQHQIARWLEILADYDFVPEYHPGRLHGNADAMSRHPDVSVITPVMLASEQDKDKLLCKIKCALQTSPIRPPWEHFQPGDANLRSLWSQWDSLVIKDDILYRRFILPDGRESFQALLPFHLRAEVLKSLHDDLAGGGHLGISKTVDKVRQRYYWPGLRKDVSIWCLHCTECKSSKRSLS